MVNELWKFAPEEALEILVKIINEILDNKGKLPQHFLGGTVRFLNKKSPLDLLSSWRPITLLEVSSKILTKIVTMRLQKIAMDSGLLCDTQEGFQPKRNTKRQLERLKQAIGLAKVHGQQVVLASVDFKNAFNAMDIGALLAILEKGF